MPLEDILRKIEEEAELKKKRILEEARTRASAQLERAQKELKEEADRLLAERRKEVELEVQRRLAQARLAGKNEVGKVKHQAWEKLQESLVAAFVEKIETEGREWCKEFLIQYVVSGDEEVWMAPREAEIWGSGFVKEINEEKLIFALWWNSRGHRTRLSLEARRYDGRFELCFCGGRVH